MKMIVGREARGGGVLVNATELLVDGAAVVALVDSGRWLIVQEVAGSQFLGDLEPIVRKFYFISRLVFSRKKPDIFKLESIQF